jgi:hypothetical protein
LSKDGYVDAETTLKRADLHDNKPLERRASSENGYESKRARRKPEPITAVLVANTDAERDKTNDKHLKIIEDQMIQSKQAERALKRKEGDVKKEQRQIRQAVREFDSSKFFFTNSSRSSLIIQLILNSV